MALSSPGIGSSLDINGIISKLMQVESQPLAALAQKEASYQTKLSAFGTLSGTLSAFKTALSSLNNRTAFESLSAKTSDAGVLTASAGSQAAPGSYNIDVTAIAKAQTISSAGASSTTTAIGGSTTTTLTFQFGTISGGTLTDGKYTGATFVQDANQGTGTVTVDSTNNSLQGIRNAINKAGIGVTATIVSDGSSAAPNHLVLTSNKTGATSSMKVLVQGDTDVSNLLAYDPAGIQKSSQNTAAQNTVLTVNGIAISNPSTKVSEAIQGVTLDIAKVGSSSLTVARDTTAIKAGVAGLVKAYNDLNSTFKNLTGYDASTKRGGPLLGDSSARNIESQIRKLMLSPIPAASGALDSLTQIGISFQKDGSLKYDAAKLDKVLSANVEDVTALFSAVGKTTDSLISFAGSSADTQPATSAIFITKLATQGSLTGVKALGTTAIDSTNSEMVVTVDGVTATVRLLENAAGYTRAQLASQVQSAINGAEPFTTAGITVNATIDSSGYLKLTSNRYGSASSVTSSGNSTATLFGVATSALGADVAGTIDGVEAIGNGQSLTGAKGSVSDGLKLFVSGGANNTGRGDVTFSQGYAFRLDKLIDNFIGSSGILKGRTEGLNRSIKDIDEAREALTDRLANTERRYRAQFMALDATISRMSSTSAYLSQQLAQLANLSSK